MREINRDIKRELFSNAIIIIMLLLLLIMRMIIIIIIMLIMSMMTMMIKTYLMRSSLEKRLCI